MNSKPLVSVVVPFFNAEKFIEEAIKSVLSQSYDAWELLFVDDGSTDCSTDIALRYAEQYPGRVRYLLHKGHENRGPSASRNLAISHAQGQYIAFLDADDVWLPHILERQVAILNSQPEAAMVYGSAQWWYSWTGKPEDLKRDYVEVHRVQLNTLINPPTLLLLLLNRIGVPCPCTVMMRRDAIARVGGFEEVQLIHEDQVFYSKVFLNMAVFVADECWAKYRLHPDSRCAIGGKTGRSISDRLAFLDWLEDYLSQEGVTNNEIWKAFRIAKKATLPIRHPIFYRLLTDAKCLANRMEQPLNTMRRLALRKSVGSIRANPNPVRVSDGSWLDVADVTTLLGITTLSWISRGTKTVEVHVGAPDGPLFSREEFSGSASTGRWVTNGMVFYLQDVSGGLPLTSKNTLGTVIVKVIPAKAHRVSIPAR